MDLLSHTFSTRIFYTLGFILIAFRLKLGFVTILESIYIIIELYFVFWGLNHIMTMIFQKQMIGEGDILLFIFLGFLFGTSKIHWIILFSSLFAIPFCKKEEIAFVPFIALATFFVLYFGVPLF